jgi:ribosomal protein S18 acetylase RimI-like enzyme
MINIIKATKKDINEYSRLKKQSLKDYSKIIGKKIPYLNKEVRKEFDVSLKKGIILLIKNNQTTVGYIIGNFMINAYHKIAYIDDLFILKEHRNKGLATRLIREFIKTAKKEKIKKAKLGVNSKNLNAINLYKNLGFKISHYDMEKPI